MPRILILGNSGSGKTTMARDLVATYGFPHLDLDAIAWDDPGVRRPLEESVAELDSFTDFHDQWVIEGSYGTLVRAALPHCTELRFLNPGTETCLAHARSRPWEPEKYDTAEAQDERLDFLLEWIASYDTRDDEYGLREHRAIFAGFEGPKAEYDAPG